MSRKKDPETEIEVLQQTIKEMRGTIKNLRKQISRKEKRVQDTEDLESRLAEKHLEDDVEDHKMLAKETCPKCAGKIEGVNIGNRALYICNDCGFRKPSKLIT